MNRASLILIIVGFIFEFCGAAIISEPTQQPGKSPNARKVYCERSFTNFAWGYQHHGIYIDPQGNLYSYSYQPKDKHWSPKQEDLPTADELEDKYSHGRKLIRTIEPNELQAKLKPLNSAINGQMSKRKQSGADMGSNVCRCYVFDDAQQAYRKVELRVQGDWSYENLAPGAKDLADWLESLSLFREKKLVH